MKRLGFFFIVILFLSGVSSCSDSIPKQTSDAGQDAGQDDDGGIDGGPDQQEIPCTLSQFEIADACDNGSFCVAWTYDCQGEELTCSYQIQACDDQDPCTRDYCDEIGKSCNHEPATDKLPEGTAEQAECANKIDDDCDGLIDMADPDCGTCTIDQDCDDQNPCTDDLCSDFACLFSPADGQPACDDGDACTMDDTCLDGVCQGLPLDNDGDGALAESCGGSDCQDGDPTITPLTPENQDSPGLCSDGIDNDCDQLVDSADSSCLQPICSPGGFCWLHPLPQGLTLNGSWSVAPNDIWVVGQQGTILRWDGANLIPSPSPTNSDLWAVWAADASRAWAVGDHGLVLEWNGSTWSASHPSGKDLRAIRGTSANDICAVGLDGGMIRFDGSKWSTLNSDTSQDLYSVEIDSLGNIWTASTGEDIRQWDGNQWTVFGSGTNAEVYAMWRVADDDIWLGGAWAIRARFDGMTWTDTDTSTSSVRTYLAFWANAGDQVWALQRYIGHSDFYFFNGLEWNKLGQIRDSSYKTIAGMGNDGIMAFGRYGLIARVDNTPTLTVLSSPMAPATQQAVIALSEQQVLCTNTTGQLMMFNGARFVQLPGAAAAKTVDISATAWNDVWLASEGGKIHHWNGEIISLVLDDFPYPFYSVWAASPSRVWVAAENKIVRYNGVRWSDVHFREDAAFMKIRGATASSSNAIQAAVDLWAVGSKIARFDGVWWTEVAMPAAVSQIVDLWIPSGQVPAQEVWALGIGDACPQSNDGKILRFADNSWQVIRAGLACENLSIHASSPDNVWVAAGRNLLQGSQSGWTEIEGLGPIIKDIYVLPDGQVYIVGESAMVATRKN